MGRQGSTRRWALTGAAAAAMAVALAPGAAQAAPAGALDTSFGSGGLVFDQSETTSPRASSVLVQAGGRIVTGGDSGDGRMLVVGYRPAGSVDTAFGDAEPVPGFHGFTTVSFAGGSVTGTAIVARPAGGIWSVGGYLSGDGMVAARLDDDGHLLATDDLGAGTTGGSLTTASVGGGDRLVVAGTQQTPDFGTPSNTASQLRVQRLRDDAARPGHVVLDTAFSGDGIADVAFDTGEATASAVTTDPGGNVVVAAELGTFDSSFGFHTSGIALARLLPDGTLDPTFDDPSDGETAGKVVAPLPGVQVGDVLVQPDGKILVLGGDAGKLLLARFSASGRPDTTFGTAGRLELPAPDAGGWTGEQLLRDAAGRLLVGAFANGRWATLRLAADGSADPAFTSTLTSLPSGDDMSLTDMALQPDGELVVAGFDQSSGNGIVLGRYLTEATSDGGGTQPPPPTTTTTQPPPPPPGTTQSPPPPAPAPAPAPPADPFVSSPVGAALQQIFGIADLHAVEDPVIDRAVDYAPYRARHRKPAGTQIGSTSKTQTLRFWTYGDVSNDVAKLTDRHLVHVNTVPHREAFDDLPDGKDVHLPGGLTLPSNYDDKLEPYQVFKQAPAGDAGPFAGTTAAPARVDVYYWDPSLDAGRHPCYQLPKKLEDAPGWDAASRLISDYRGKRCTVTVDFHDVRNADEQTRVTKVSAPDRRHVVVNVTRPQQPDLAVTLLPSGDSHNPSFDDKWRMSTDTGTSNDALRVAVTDRAVHAVPDTGGGAEFSGAIQGARVELWFDPKGGHARDRKLASETTTSKGVTPIMTFKLDEPGTVDVEVTATPKEGPALEGWTSFPVVDHHGCIRGASGYVWRKQGSEYSATYVAGANRIGLYTDCGGARGRAAADDPNSPWHRFLRLIGIEPRLAEDAVKTTSSRPAPDTCAAKAASTALGIKPSQTALGAPLSTDPTPPALRSAPVIAAGGGNLGGGTTTVADLGKDGVALTASGVIAAGGGNVIAPGGGNRAAVRARAAAATPSCTASVPQAATDLFRSSFNVAPVIAAGGGNVIAAGGGNVIAAGGGNAIDIRSASVIAAGGGNVIAAGGGNVIAAGGGNVIAAGGGNVIAAGGGN